MGTLENIFVCGVDLEWLGMEMVAGFCNLCNEQKVFSKGGKYIC